MKIIHSPDTIPQTSTILRQRWLYWNVPAYFAATWIRHAREYFASSSRSSENLIWEEIDWPRDVDFDAEKIDLGTNLQQVTALLIGIEPDQPCHMIKNLGTIRNHLTTTLVRGNEVRSKAFVIALSFDADKAFKRTLLEMGADYVVESVASVPRLTKMIAEKGSYFPSSLHPFLPANINKTSF